MATASVRSLPAEWADPDDVGRPLLQLAAGVQDLATLRCLVEGLTLLFDFLPRITGAYATALADLLCQLLARLGTHPACTAGMLDAAAGEHYMLFASEAASLEPDCWSQARWIGHALASSLPMICLG